MACLEKRVALINGATSPLGQAVALAFAAHGADLLLLYPHREEGAIGADLARHVVGMGRRAVLLHGDAATQEGAYMAVQSAIIGFGGIDILVANADLPVALDGGVLSDPAALDAVMRAGLAPQAQLDRLVLPQMAARGYGRLITTLPAAAPGSVDGVLAGALIGYAQALAAHLPPGDITANAVALPGRNANWAEVAQAYVALARDEARAWRGRVL